MITQLNENLSDTNTEHHHLHKDMVPHDTVTSD